MSYTIYKKGFLLDTSTQLKNALTDTVMVVEMASFWLFTRLIRSRNDSILFLLYDVCGHMNSLSIRANPFIASHHGVFTQSGTLTLIQNALPYGHVLPASCSVDLVDRDVLDTQTEFFKAIKVVTSLVAVVYFTGQELKSSVTYSVL